MSWTAFLSIALGSADGMNCQTSAFSDDEFAETDAAFGVAPIVRVPQSRPWIRRPSLGIIAISHGLVGTIV